MPAASLFFTENKRFRNPYLAHHPFMTRAQTRTHFHSSCLLRILTDLACLQAPASGAAFAEKMGLWVDYTHAIVLCAVHNAQWARTPDLGGGPDHAPAEAAETAFARQRSLLEHSIRSAKLPPLDLAEATFETYRRYYLGQQRDLDLKVPVLRSRVREGLAQASPALQQLAALDAALEGVLAARESQLLATLPHLLKQRFTQLADSHDPQQPASWLLRFREELQTVLLAELDLRLQPAVGLVEALTSQPHSKPPSEPVSPPCTV
jgi:hypothetical protein